MRKFLLLLIALGYCGMIVAQIIPQERRVNWEEALSSFSFIEPVNRVNIMDFGAVADGKTDNSVALTAAMTSLDGHAGQIYFPEGNYLFKNPIIMKDSVILRGGGAKKSHLLFDLKANKHAVRVEGSQDKHFVSLKAGFDKGSRQLVCDSAFYFHAGDWVEIREQNGDWNTAPVDWADWSVGQVGRLLAISGDTLFIEHPLRIDYSPNLHPQIQRIYPIQNVGLECLKIERMSQQDTTGGYNVYFDLAANCLLRGVESDSSVASHVYISRSTQIRVEGSYFHHAFAYDGVNTHGYGVTLAHHSGECLITNNIFEHLRHAMMVKTGANGNVFSYNFSTDPFRSEQNPDASGDISLHGHYAFSNLFEGNIVQNIVIDHYWGPSGPWNTFFRNRAELWGIIMTESDTTETSRQNFVGNETTDADFFHGLFALTGTDHFVYGNHILQQIILTGTDSLPDKSYYLQTLPDFWPAELGWPSVGLPGPLGEGSNPAQIRYMSGTDFTVCPDSSGVSVEKMLMHNLSFQIIPNPASSQFQLRFQQVLTNKLSYKIYNLQGQKVWEGVEFPKGQSKVILRPGITMIPGVYLLYVSLGKNQFVKKVVFK